MRIALDVTLAHNLDGGVWIQKVDRPGAGFLHGEFHRCAGRHGLRSREVQILGEAVVAKIALSERGPALEHERVPQAVHLGDPGQHPREKVVPLQDFPGKTEPLAGFL